MPSKLPRPAARAYAAAVNSGSGTNELFKTLGAGAVLVGAAYLVGLLYDRYADQITQPLERHIRTLVVISALKNDHQASIS
jgi:hypothetical protein